MELIFLRPDDFRTRIKDSVFAAMVQQNGNEIDLQEIELAVIEEISSYLRNEYDVAKIFAPPTEGQWDKRPQLIVLFATDMVLYHLSSRLNINEAATEKREKRYNAALAWLKAVNTGKLVPDLPRAQKPEQHEAGGMGSIRWKAKPPRR